MTLSEICAVIDLDGFCIGKEFLPRELGYASLTKPLNQSFRFNLNRYESKLSEKDRKTVWYCTHRIHGLSFVSPRWEKDLFWVEHLKPLVQNIYNENKTRDKFLVAYKGGHLEKNILNELQIPSVNLEDFACPKYEDLPPPEIKDCGYHDKTLISAHCPKKETFAFANWIRNFSNN